MKIYWKKVTKSLIVCMIISMGLIPSTPSFAQATPLEISIIGDLSLNSNGTVNLEKTGITRQEVVTASAIEGEENTGPAAAAVRIPGNDKIIHRWDDVRKWGIVIRYGAQQHVLGKHDLSMKAVKGSTLWPKEYYRDPKADVHTWIFRSPVHRVECTLGFVCKAKEEKTIRTVHSYRKLGDKESKGLITSYCEGVTKCPAWVNDVAEKAIPKL